MFTLLDLTRLLPCRFEVAVQVAMAWADMAVTVVDTEATVVG